MHFHLLKVWKLCQIGILDVELREAIDLAPLIVAATRSKRVGVHVEK